MIVLIRLQHENGYKSKSGLERYSSVNLVLAVCGADINYPGGYVEPCPMSPRITYLLASEPSQPSFPPQGQIYSRDSLKAAVQVLGCKPRTALQLSESVFERLEEQVWGQGHRRSRVLWRLHPRANGGFWVSLPRGYFNRMVVEGLMECGRKGRIVEDWKIATRCGGNPKAVLVDVAL